MTGHGHAPMAGGSDDLVTWRDLERHRAEEAAARDLLRHETDERMRAIERVIEQLRGARTVVGFLIGSNALVLVAFILELAGRYRAPGA